MSERIRVHICSGRIAYGFLSGGGQSAFFLLITIHQILPLWVCMRASRVAGSVNLHGTQSCATQEKFDAGYGTLPSSACYLANATWRIGHGGKGNGTPGSTANIERGC
jgi:hypothetical protein